MSDIGSDDYDDSVKSLTAKCKAHEETLRHIMETFCGVQLGEGLTFDMAPAFVEGQIDKQSDRADKAEQRITALLTANDELEKRVKELEAERPQHLIHGLHQLDKERVERITALEKENAELRKAAKELMDWHIESNGCDDEPCSFCSRVKAVLATIDSAAKEGK